MVQVDFGQLVASLMLRLSHKELDLFWVICWQIWLQQNSVLHGGAFQHPSRSYKRALDYLSEFHKAQEHLSVAVTVPVSTSQVWQPPQGDFFKLNFDGADSGYGAVVCNGNGEVMAAISAKGKDVRDSEKVEVLACRKALEFAIDAGFMEVILESDNARVLKTVAQAQPDLAQLGFIYEDIWCLIAGFRSFLVNCVRRSANGVAHALVRFARLSDNETIWLEEDPPPATDALYLDSSILH